MYRKELPEYYVLMHEISCAVEHISEFLMRQLAIKSFLRFFPFSSFGVSSCLLTVLHPEACIRTPN